MKAELVPDNGDRPIPITKDVTVIGRKDCCDVVIDHDSLSKRHAVVVKTDGLLVIRDLATTNGTKVKGQKIRWAALLPDDRITLGAYKLRVYLGSDSVPGPSERVGAGKTAKPVAAGPSTPQATTPKKPDSGFAAPSPLSIPVVNSNSADGLEIIEEESDESGWQRLITAKPSGNEDVIIELD